MRAHVAKDPQQLPDIFVMRATVRKIWSEMGRREPLSIEDPYGDHLVIRDLVAEAYQGTMATPLRDWTFSAISCALFLLAHGLDEWHKKIRQPCGICRDAWPMICPNVSAHAPGEAP